MEHYYNEVNSWLLVGADIDVAADLGFTYDETLRHLREDKGVNWVLDVRSEWNDREAWVEYGLPLENYCHLPIIDSHSHDPDEGWYRGVQDFVTRFLDQAGPDERLYAHCHMGINRGPSAAMLALLIAEPHMDPWDAFMQIREARSVAGLVYADKVAAWHIIQKHEDPTGPMTDFIRKYDDYWTPELIKSVNRGIAYYRSVEGGTQVVR